MNGPVAAHLAAALAAALSSERLLTHPDDCADYAVQGCVPTCVVIPKSQDELSAILRVAQDLQAVVVPWGGGTHQAIGGPPEHVDLVVCTSSLCQVLRHEPGDLTISVEAGMPIGALHTYLAGYGQMLPIDPALPERATIGGVIATAADGPRRLGYGTLRDLLIGITVVEVGGGVSHAGGMVVKNVSGFDMMKLYQGSFGTLAIVASANFKLLPLPRATGSLVSIFDTPTRAFAAVEALQTTQLTPSAVEFLNADALAMLGYIGACGIVMRAEGLAESVDRHLADMASMARSAGAVSVMPLMDAAERGVWARIGDMSQTASLASDEVVIKLTMLPSEVAATIAQVDVLAVRGGYPILVDARVLSGVVYARVRGLDAARLARLLPLLPALQWVATTLPGTLRWGEVPSGIDLMRRIKSEFDPLRLLNRGRFLEGI